MLFGRYGCANNARIGGETDNYDAYSPKVRVTKLVTRRQ